MRIRTPNALHRVAPRGGSAPRDTGLLQRSIRTPQALHRPLSGRGRGRGSDIVSASQIPSLISRLPQTTTISPHVLHQLLHRPSCNLPNPILRMKYRSMPGRRRQSQRSRSEPRVYSSKSSPSAPMDVWRRR